MNFIRSLVTCLVGPQESLLATVTSEVFQPRRPT